jgi:hypothetical protein
VLNVREQPPAEGAALQCSPVFAVTVIVPVGAAKLVDPATFTATATGCDGTAGFGDTEVMVVVVVALVALVD